MTAPSPSSPALPAGATALTGNLMVVTGICLCLAVILATLLFTAWRKLCRAPPCSTGRQGSMHSTGGRKLSDEASIFGNSLQRPSLMEAQGLQGMGTAGQRQTSLLGSQSLSHPLVLPLSPDPDRLSPSGQKMLPPVFGYVWKIAGFLSSMSSIVYLQSFYSVIVAKCSAAKRFSV